jgi:phosphatidylserine decarboxylase
VTLQHLYPKRLLSAGAYRVTRLDWRWLNRRLIRWFARHYRVDLSEALEPDLDAYPDFNTFFTRALRPGIRPIAADRGAICAPADGLVAAAGLAEEGELLQAKGRRYSVSSLLADDPRLSPALRDAAYVTIYLSPRDYHRVHVPLDCTVTRLVHVPGELFSVNLASAERIP